MLAKVAIFGEQSYDARERGGWRSGGSSSVGGKQLLGRETGGDTAVVKMQKDKGWPDEGCAGGRPSVVVASGKLWGSGLGLMGPL